MKPQVKTILLFLYASLQGPHSVIGAHILFHHQIASYSHQAATYPLAEGLLKQGHEITYITPWNRKGKQSLHPNITMIIPENYRKTMADFLETDLDINHRVKRMFPRLVDQFYPAATTLCRDLLTSSELEAWMVKTSKLDLMIIDNCMAECGLAIAQKFGAKHIFFNTLVHWGNEYDFYGFNAESSAIPELEIEPPITPMTFMERVVNTLIPIYFRWVHYSYLKEIDLMVREYLKDPEMPFIDDIARNASLVFYTADLVTDYPRSHPPFLVNVGGLHCNHASKRSELPTNVKNVIEDSSSDGFIYISFGTVAMSSKLPDSVTQVFINTINTFPKLKFLWKWNGPPPENIPKNLHLAQWFQQTDILAHPKIKGFITQSGRPSTQEALCNAVPMIAFPVLADQDINANRMNQIGANIKLELALVTRDELKDAIQKLAYSFEMKARMIQLRDILNDQPIPPLEKAVWWTEYVLKHRDTSHLKPAGFNQWWFQRRLLDVWAFLFTIIMAIITIASSILICFIKRVLPNKKTKLE